MTKIIEYGSIWESRLQQLIHQNQSFYAISKTLGADIRLVKRKSQVITIDKSEIKTFETQKNHYRKIWSKLLREVSRAAISHAREAAPRIYKWLYRHDKEWLREENLGHVHKEKEVQLRIDWSSRDKLVLRDLQSNYSILQQRSRRKITKSILLNSVSMARNIPWSRVETQMPKSSAFINSIKESNINFQQRKISMAIDELSENNMKMNRSAILVKAGLRKLTLEANDQLTKLFG